MREAMAVLSLGAALMAAQPARSDDHLLTRQAAQERLLQAEAARQRNLATVRGVLSAPEAVKAAAAVGADLEALRASAAALSDAELAELARRAAELRSDPVAGLDADIKMLLMIFLIVAIVILVLKAV